MASASSTPVNPPPDPAPHRPALRLPPGASDCHAHVFGPWDQFPLQSNPGYVPALAPVGAYVRMLRAIGVSRAVLVQPSPYGTDNAAMLSALRSGLFSFRGIAIIGEATLEADLQQMHDLGVQGIRLHLTGPDGDRVIASLPRIAERIRRYGWHIQFYLNAAERPDIDRTLLALPVPVVIDHFGLVPASGGVQSPGFQCLLRLAASGRCWFKLSAPYRVSKEAPGYADVVPLVRGLLEAAPDRCVWGTDWPHPNAAVMPNDGDLVDLLTGWLPTEALRQKVLVSNPSNLYGF